MQLFHIVRVCYNELHQRGEDVVDLQEKGVLSGTKIGGVFWKIRYADNEKQRKVNERQLQIQILILIQLQIRLLLQIQIQIQSTASLCVLQIGIDFYFDL